MTMHLCGPALTTTSTKKRSKKITKSQQAEFERGRKERNRRLKEMRLPKETFEQYMGFVYGRGKKEKSISTNGLKSSSPIETHNSQRTMENKKILSLNVSISGPCFSKPSPTYTGLKIIGIATLHKSCLQPIFSNEETIEVARMRR